MSRLSTAFGLTSTTLIWFLPFATMAYHAISGSPESGLPNDSTGAGLSSPPPWFVSGSEVSRWPELIFRSARLSLGTAIPAIAFGTLLAFLLERCHWPSNRWFKAFWRSAIFLPLPVFATAWLGAFANLGRSQAFGLSDRPLVDGWMAACCVHTLAALPLIVWIMGGAMSRSDSTLEDFARMREPTGRAIVLSTLRRCRSAAISAGLVVLILTAGDMTVTDLVQERTFAEEAYLQAQMGDGLAASARTALPITLVVLVSILIWAYASSDRLRSTVGNRSSNPNPAPWFDGRAGKFAALAVLVATSIIWFVPAATLVWRAGRSGGMAASETLPSWSFDSLQHNLIEALPDLRETLPTSLAIAAVTALAGTFIAWNAVAIASKSKCFRVFLILGSALGLATPGPVAGLAVLWFWMPVRFLYDSPFVIVAALLFRFLGIAVFWLWVAARSVSDDVRDLARLEGLSAVRKFRQLEWPMTAPWAVASTVVVFALAVSELPATNMTTPPGVELVSVRLWALMHTGLESHLAAFVILVTLSLGGIIAAAAIPAVRLLRHAGVGHRIVE